MGRKNKRHRVATALRLHREATERIQQEALDLTNSRLADQVREERRLRLREERGLFAQPYHDAVAQYRATRGPVTTRPLPTPKTSPEGVDN